MKFEMLYSIVIPVYNAERYLRKAVESALEQQETGEVILVEDGSNDCSLDVCRELVRRYDRVKLYEHPGGVNMGPGATRNLGINKAGFEFIAFLDADDFFLPRRFKKTNQLLLKDPCLDGIGEAVGCHFYSDEGRRLFESRGENELTAMHRQVGPDDFFEEYSPIGKCGYIATPGWTIRRDALLAVGGFPEELWLHQDTALYIKLAAVMRLTTGEIEKPVALRGVHSGNRISAGRPLMERYRHEVLMWNHLLKWGRGIGEREKWDVEGEMRNGSRVATVQSTGSSAVGSSPICKRTDLPATSQRCEHGSQAYKLVLSRERWALLRQRAAERVGSCYAFANCRVQGRLHILKQLALVAKVAPALLQNTAVRRSFMKTFVNP